MKRTWVLGGIVFLACAGVGLVPVIGAGIKGSSHDFTGSGWSYGQLCSPCHTPHRADTTVPGAPLWNHEVTTATYTVYSSPTLDATDVGQPTGVSRLCLSCHDGTVALDSFGGATGSSFVSAPSNVGTDLSNDHPISFTYDAGLAAADGGLHDPTTAGSGLGKSIDEDLLFNHRVECASCHDVHNTGGYPRLLRMNNTGSALCLTCHDK